MKRQWTCPRCRFACPSTWLSLKPSKAAICNICRSKGANSKCVSNPNPPKQLSEDEGAKLNNNVAEKTPPRTISHENVAFSVGKIGMIFGNLTFEPKVKSEVFTAADHFCRGKSLKPSTTSTIQIKQEHEVEKEPIWDMNEVQKKKRSKLPQYTLWPLARFINQLQRTSGRRRRHGRIRLPIGPKYDDVLIYQKCVFVAENEIGLGARLLSPGPEVYD